MIHSTVHFDALEGKCGDYWILVVVAECVGNVVVLGLTPKEGSQVPNLVILLDTNEESDSL